MRFLLRAPVGFHLGVPTRLAKFEVVSGSLDYFILWVGSVPAVPPSEVLLGGLL